MNKRVRDQEDNAGVDNLLAHNKSRDVILLMPFIGALLIASPLLGIFSTNAKIFGLPLPFVQLFLSWLGMIIILGFVNRRFFHHRQSAQK